MSEKKIKIHSDADAEAADQKETTENPLPEDPKDLEGEKKTADEGVAQDPINELKEKLAAKEQEAQDNYDRLLRISAELENYKKRTAREMEEYRKFSNQALIKEMLAVVDHLELAMNSTNGHKAIEKGLVEGLQMTHSELLKVFEKFHVTPIKAMGEPFDPTFHEAVMQEETDDFPENTVAKELQKGYMIHDRLLRPAMVVVAKSATKKS